MSGLKGLARKVLGSSETPEQKKAHAQKEMKKAKLKDEIADLEIQLCNKRDELQKLG